MVATNPVQQSTAAPAGMPPQVMLLQMANAYRVSQSIYVAAKLGIADQLAEGARSIEDLAEATQTHAQSLYRLLRALASMGIFAETEGGEFELTPRAELLRSTVPNSLRNYAIVIGESWHWQMWGDIVYSVKTGRPAFDRLHGTDFETYYANHPSIAQTFDQAMVSLLEGIDASICSGYDFSAVQTIVDIGIPGSDGHLTELLLKANPQLKSIVLDTAARLELARARLRDYSDRCEFIVGEVIQSLPIGGDVYILKNLIHDLDDESALEVLKHCCAAMSNNATLLVVEMLVPLRNEAALSKIVDIEALLMTKGGYERTEMQYRSLLKMAGLTLETVISTRSPFSILEAKRA